MQLTATRRVDTKCLHGIKKGNRHISWKKIPNCIKYRHIASVLRNFQMTNCWSLGKRIRNPLYDCFYPLRASAIDPCWRWIGGDPGSLVRPWDILVVNYWRILNLLDPASVMSTQNISQCLFLKSIYEDMHTYNWINTTNMENLTLHTKHTSNLITHIKS